MLNTLENTINMYNSIFVDKSTDFRLESCELKDFTLNCMALDEIELSVACIVNMPNIADSRYKEMDVIEWKYIKKDCSFYFYPTIPEVKIDELMQELSIGKCKQYSYGTESICNYKTCTFSAADYVKTCDFLTDVFLKINRKPRDLEEIQFLSAVLCSRQRDVLGSFYKFAASELENRLENDEIRRQFAATTVSFLDFVKSLSEQGKSQSVGDSDFFSEVKEVSGIISELMLRRKDNGNIILSEIYKNTFSEKVNDFYRVQSKRKTRAFGSAKGRLKVQLKKVYEKSNQCDDNILNEIEAW